MQPSIGRVNSMRDLSCCWSMQITVAVGAYYSPVGRVNPRGFSFYSCVYFLSLPYCLILAAFHQQA